MCTVMKAHFSHLCKNRRFHVKIIILSNYYNVISHNNETVSRYI